MPARPANSSAVTTGPSSRVKRQRDQQAQRLLRAVLVQRVIALQAQHEADEQAGHRDDDQRIIADEVNLLASPVAAGATSRAEARSNAKKVRVAKPTFASEFAQPTSERAETSSAIIARAPAANLGHVARIMKRHRAVGFGMHELLHITDRSMPAFRRGVPCATIFPCDKKYT